MKKKSVDAELLSTPYTELKEPLFQNDGSMLDGYLQLREQRIQGSARQHIQHYVNTAINAELAGGHDLYRTFRVSKLTRCLAEALGWESQRIDLLALGAQVCNIGMVAIPSRILLKPGNLLLTNARSFGTMHDTVPLYCVSRSFRVLKLLRCLLSNTMSDTTELVTRMISVESQLRRKRGLLLSRRL